MDFKFAVGQSVEYTPVKGTRGLFTVIRQMPEEHRAFDRTYRIKSEQEGFERNVMECDLTVSERPKESYETAFRPRGRGGR